MKHLTFFLIFILSAVFVQAQGIQYGIYTGYGKIFDPGVIEQSELAPSVLALQQSTMNTEDNIVSLDKSADYTPMIIQMSYGRIVEGGIKYEFNFSSPQLVYPISKSDLIGVEEKFRSNSLSLFFRKNSNRCTGIGSYHFFGIEGGKRWGKKIIEYTDDFKQLDPEAKDVKLNLKSAYFVSLQGGLGYGFSENFSFELMAFVSPFNRYQLDNKVDKVNSHRFGIVAGFKFAIDEESFLPCF